VKGGDGPHASHPPMSLEPSEIRTVTSADDRQRSPCFGTRRVLTNLAASALDQIGYLRSLGTGSVDELGLEFDDIAGAARSTINSVGRVTAQGAAAIQQVGRQLQRMSGAANVLRGLRRRCQARAAARMTAIEALVSSSPARHSTPSIPAVIRPCM